MKRYSSRGSALIYILIAIALIAALTTMFMQPASQQTRSQNSFKLAAELNGQVQMIRAAIQDCILQYPEGDSGINVAGYVGPNYPLDADSTYLDSPAASGTKDVASIRCPGNNPGAPNSNQHGEMFGGNSGRFMPATPAMFSPWIYRNGTGMAINGVNYTGVFFEIRSTATDAFVTEAMQKVDDQFTACEAEYIAGDGSNGCPASTQCLRVWVKRQAPTCP